MTLRRDRWGEAFITDENNVILDCAFGPIIRDATEMDLFLNHVAGIVEHGLFVGLCQEAIIGTADGVRRISV